MNILGIIPAREGSKRLPGKNMKVIGGKPLVQWAVESALGSKKLNRVLVSSDSGDVLRLSSIYNDVQTTFLKRPAEIAGDISPAIEYIKHSLEYLQLRDETYDIIVIIQPTSPFTLSTDIDGTIELLEKSGSDSAVSIIKAPHDINPLKMKILRGDRLYPYVEEEGNRMSKEQLDDVYLRNCSVYASRIEVIDQGRIIGDDCRGFIMPRERSVDINDEFDLAFAEFLYLRNKN